MIHSFAQTIRSTPRTIRSAKCRALVLVLILTAIAEQGWADCTVSAGSVSFGSYNVFNQSDLNRTGRIDVTCSPSASYTIALSPGSGTYTQRKMVGGGSILDYNLYANVGRTSVWGNGTGGTVTVGGAGTSASHTVYGRIPARQNKKPGNYSDTITVTLTF